MLVHASLEELEELVSGWFVSGWSIELVTDETWEDDKRHGFAQYGFA